VEARLWAQGRDAAGPTRIADTVPFVGPAVGAGHHSAHIHRVATRQIFTGAIINWSLIVKNWVVPMCHCPAFRLITNRD